jgi:nitrite reductase/ring-hydroxylating ferredoxin subunit
VKVDIGPLQAFPSQAISIVKVNRTEIGLVRSGDDLYALRNICPHQTGPLCRGKLVHAMASPEPGVMELSETDLLVACPWHGWEFDVRTGSCISDAKLRVATYPVEVHEGRVLVVLR